jgi:hypothetical protein
VTDIAAERNPAESATASVEQFGYKQELGLDLVRPTVWAQARAVLCSNGGQHGWFEWISRRLSPVGLEVRPTPRPPRYREAEEDEP